MTRRIKWLAGGVVFAVGNFAGGVFAAAQGEIMHAGLHGGLLLLSVLVVSRFGPGSQSDQHSTQGKLSGDLSGDLSELQHSVDALAIEVERVGEAQRFTTQLAVGNDIHQRFQ